MNMKDHILAALREQLDRWEALLSSLSEAQITSPLLPSDWSTKDEIAHCYAWQRRSIARLEAALHDQEPQFPQWLPGIDPDDYGNTDQVNAWIYAAYRDLSWASVHENWRDGYLQFIKLGEGISEKDLLDSGRYPWLGGHSLAFILIASYDHHQEHYEKLLIWLKESGKIKPDPKDFKNP